MNHHRGAVLGVSINAVSEASALEQLSEWAAKRESRGVFFCNAHVVATARTDRGFGRTISEGDLCLPDGAPVAAMLRRAGYPDQERVSGPDLMLRYLELADSRKEAVFLYGSTEKTLLQLQAVLKTRFPGLEVHSYSPPFRNLSKDEDAAIVDMINRSGARTVWVALGCPKQERWIIEHKGKIAAVMLGVGAAFAFHAGVISRAPTLMRDHGLEWLHRLVTDPRRLWRRYLVTNTQFVFYALVDVLRNAASLSAVKKSERRAGHAPSMARAQTKIEPE